MSYGPDKNVSIPKRNYDEAIETLNDVLSVSPVDAGVFYQAAQKAVLLLKPTITPGSPTEAPQWDRGI